MNLRKTLFSSFAAASLLLGSGGGIALAAIADTDEAETNLTVSCSPTSTIDLTTSNFTLNTDGGNTDVAAVPGGFEIVMDLSCNWTTDFQVNAEISSFVHQNPLLVPSSQALWFSGDALELTGGTLDYDGVWNANLFAGPLAGPPEYQTSIFSGNAVTDGAVIEDASFWTWFFIWFYVPVASPGISTATYDADLVGLPNNLAPGVYSADMTVELVVN